MLAIVFDFDGTILDTETPEYEVWKQLFESYGQTLSWETWAAQIGRGANETHERPADILARLIGNPSVSVALHQRSRVEVCKRIDESELRPGVRDLIEKCLTQGIPLAVASSSRHDWVDPFLKKHDLFDSFQAICCVGDVERGKPFPDTYLLALERLGVLPSQAVAIEDSANGCAAGRAAGMYVVAYPNEVTKSLDFSAADVVLDSLEGVKLVELTSLVAEKQGDHDESKIAVLETIHKNYPHII